MDRRASFPPDFELILASQSPRRHSLLRDLGVPFRVAVSQAEEVLSGGEVRALAERNALEKVRGAVLPADVSAGAFVLGTDTVVTIDGRVMGKPTSADDAAAMLRALSGRTHQVVSGVALARGVRALAQTGAGDGPLAGPLDGALQVASAVTAVTFLPLQEDDIAAYLSSGEWRGKAGAYAIQGLAGLFVAGIEGEYSNVVGLPLCLLAQMFRRLGFDLVRGSWA